MGHYLCMIHMYFDVDTTLFKCFRIFENGKETTMTYENDVLISKSINGVPQPITESGTGGGAGKRKSTSTRFINGKKMTTKK